MTRRVWFLLVAILASGLIAAGCGGDDDENGSDDGPAATQEQTGTTDTTATATTETETETEPGDVPDEDIEQAVEECKEGVRQAPQLSDDTKSDLEELCEQAESGDVEEAREASVEVCKEIVEDTVPEAAGELRDQLLAECEQANP